MRPTRVPPTAALTLVLVALLGGLAGGCGGERAVNDGGETAEPPPAAVEPAAVEPAAPPRTKLGAMRSVRIVSDVVFEGFPDHPHTLDFTCAFPLRSRMELAGGPGKQMRYQFGERLWALERPSRPKVSDEVEPPVSEELMGDTLAEQQLDFAARRALYLWPDEGLFEGDGLTRTCSAPLRAGVLVATLHPTTGLPVDVRGFNAAGRCTVQLVVDEWFEAEGRTWPRRARLVDGDATVWTETTRTAEGRWFYGDSTFVPPDERVRALGTKLGLVARELPPAYVVDVPFAPGDIPREASGGPAAAALGADGAAASVRTAIALAVRRWAELEAHLAASGASVSQSVAAAVTLDPTGAPSGLRFTLPVDAVDRPPPPFRGIAWVARPLVHGWRLALDADVPDARALDLVRSEAAEGDGRSAAEVDLSLQVDIAPSAGGNPRHWTGQIALLGLCPPVGPSQRGTEGEPGSGSTYDSGDANDPAGDPFPGPLEFVPPRDRVRPSTPGDDPPR